MRLLWTLAHVSLDHFSSSTFLTLTYPKGDPNATLAKTHLDTFLKRLRRLFPTAAALWKLEYTKAATPHFHLLLFGVPFWHHRRAASAWAQIVGSNHPSHRAAGTRIETLNSKRHALRYIAKYVSKASPIPNSHRGRIWGKTSNLASLFSEQIHFMLTQAQALTIRRILDLVRRAQNRRKRFSRAWNLDNSQRWFIAGDTIRKLCEAFQIKCLPVFEGT